MNNSIRSRFVQALSALSLAMPLLAGCGAQDVHPAVSMVDRSTKALSLGSFLEINGQYGPGCTSRSGSWSVGIGTFVTLTNPTLSVTQHDFGCTLSASSARVGSPQSSQLYSPAAAIALGASFASSGSAFNLVAGDPVAFYGNLEIQPDLSFATDFSIKMVYSEDLNLVSASMIASYAVQSATATADGVSAPDYFVDVTGLTLQVDVNKTVQAAGGVALLTAGNITGQSFVVSANDLGAAPSYTAVDAEFQSGVPSSLSASSPMIAAADFALTGADLSMPQIRTLLIANDVAGTRSYEVFRIGFSAP